jgi:NADH:ubiquinone oxidoreductase subunit 2 (subunit N)
MTIFANWIYDFIFFIFFVKKSEFYFFVIFSTFMMLLRTFSTFKYFSSFIANAYFFSYATIFSGALAKIYFFDSPFINNILSTDYFFYFELAVIKTLVIFFWAILVFFLITFYYNEYFEKNEFKLFSIDLSLCGALYLVDSSNFVEIFLALELIAFPTYTLISLEKTKESTEAALKYFIYSVYASLILIISFIVLFIYSGQNSFFQNIIYSDYTKIELAGFLFFIAFIVKLGIGPFYHWAPPVYQAVSPSVFIFISTVSKVPLLVIFAYLSKTSFFVVGSWSFFCIIFLLVMGVFISARDLISEKNIRRIIAYTSNINFTVGILGFFFGFFNINSFIIYIGFYLLSNLSVYIWHLVLNSDFFAKKEITKIEWFQNEDNFSKFIVNTSVIINSGLPPLTLFFLKIVIFGNISFLNPNISFNLLGLFVSIFILFCSLSSYFAYFNILKSLNYKENAIINEIWQNKKNIYTYTFADFLTLSTIVFFFKLLFIF